MAADTVPAAVPDPNDPAAASTNRSPQPGALTSLFAAVDPARPATPAFDLNPTTETAGHGTNDETSSGASSAAYHDDSTKDADSNSGNGSGNSTGNRQERSVLRAWLLAGADRWKKGGDARLERLRISKAKATALQVKETRTVSVNRAGGGLFGGTSNRSGGGSGAAGGGKPGNGKGLGGKSGGGNSPKGPKNKPGASGNGSTGRSGSGGGSGTGGGGRGPSGGSGGQPGAGPRSQKNSGGTGNGKGPSKGGGGNTGGTDKPSKAKDPKTPTPKNSPDSKSSTGKDGKHGPAGNGPAGTGKAGPQGPAGPASKNPPAPAPAPGGKNNTPKNSDPKTGPKPDASADAKKSPAADKVSLDKTSKTKKTDTPKTLDPKASDQKDPNTKGTEPKDPKDSKDPAKGADPKDPKSTAPAPEKTDTSKGKPQQPSTAQANGKPSPLQDSRETGYRDGSRTAKTVAHVKAYRDGFNDGRKDTTEAAEREKARLDKAHQQRKQELQQQREKDIPVTGQASSADYHPPKPTEPPPTTPAPAADPDNEVKPVWVRGISADTVDLYSTNASYRDSMSRGEVRTLRRFQQRLEHKTNVMTRIVDATRVLEQHAQEQAKAVIKLLEQAKAVKGGDQLAGKLAKLADDAMVQATKAAELHTRSLRAAEACQALHANTSKRYEPIYQAVVNSPLTTPAELAYYREMTHA
jgi:hypothetical protein